MPNEPTAPMRALAEEAEAEIARLMTALETGAIDAAEWEAEMQQILTRYQIGAYMVGQGDDVLTAAELAEITAIVQEQLLYLSNFRLVIQSSAEFMAGWRARAALYANAMNRAYWSGRTKMWPLPAMPGQGTICQTNCRCSWREEIIDADNGDADFYWELDPFVEDGQHCQTCLQRAEEWAPVHIRGGVLQL